MKDMFLFDDEIQSVEFIRQELEVENKQGGPPTKIAVYISPGRKIGIHYHENTEHWIMINIERKQVFMPNLQFHSQEDACGMVWAIGPIEERLAKMQNESGPEGIIITGVAIMMRCCGWGDLLEQSRSDHKMTDGPFQSGLRH